ncbi:MAG: hypothetical protein PUC82_01240 [bacterium]|nr:hypothetical protein [bacterium]
MLNTNYLEELLTISIVLSTITCSLIQKTKSKFKTNKYILLYSLFINLIFSIAFCQTFTSINFPTSLWIGFFSFIGADSIYKVLKGRLKTHTELTEKVTIPKENIINKEEN